MNLTLVTWKMFPMFLFLATYIVSLQQILKELTFSNYSYERPLLAIKMKKMVLLLFVTFLGATSL